MRINRPEGGRPQPDVRPSPTTAAAPARRRRTRQPLPGRAAERRRVRQVRLRRRALSAGVAAGLLVVAAAAVLPGGAVALAAENTGHHGSSWWSRWADRIGAIATPSASADASPAGEETGGTPTTTSAAPSTGTTTAAAGDAAAAGAGAGTVDGVSDTAEAESTPTAPVASATTTASLDGRRGLWYAIGSSPTQEQLEAAPSLYGVVVLNPWETDALRTLKAEDPSIVVLAYKCLASARSYDDSDEPPAGVTWAEVQQNPSWLAKDTAGEDIEWNGYSGHWQMAVWDASYQSTWAEQVTATAVDGGWDGIFADNDISTLAWYSSGLLAGTSTQDATDAKIRDGLQGLIDTAGAELNAAGKLLVPNISDARLYEGRWAAHARYGGGMEENFVHFGTATDSSSYVSDWGDTGWVTQTGQLDATETGIALAVTRAAPSDVRATRYGYASLLVRGGSNTFWQPSADSSGTYGTPQSIKEMSWRTGDPVTAGTELDSGAWTRTYDNVWVAVNPTDAPVTVTPPHGATNTEGRVVTSVTLAATSGVVLQTM